LISIVPSSFFLDSEQNYSLLILKKNRIDRPFLNIDKKSFFIDENSRLNTILPLEEVGNSKDGRIEKEYKRIEEQIQLFNT